MPKYSQSRLDLEKSRNKPFVNIYLPSICLIKDSMIIELIIHAVCLNSEMLECVVVYKSLIQPIKRLDELTSHTVRLIDKPTLSDSV